MGIFPPPIPKKIVALINMISSIDTHMGNPCVLPNPTKVESFGNKMLLPLAKLSYLMIQSESESIVWFPHEDELD